MRYIGGGIGHLTLGVGQDKTNDDEMDIDSEVDEDIPHQHSDGAHFVSQPHALALVIEGGQDDVTPGVDNDGNESDGSDGSDESDESDDSDSDTDQDSEKSASDSEEDSDDDGGYASL